MHYTAWHHIDDIFCHIWSDRHRLLHGVHVQLCPTLGLASSAVHALIDPAVDVGNAGDAVTPVAELRGRSSDQRTANSVACEIERKAGRCGWPVRTQAERQIQRDPGLGVVTHVAHGPRALYIQRDADLTQLAGD